MEGQTMFAGRVRSVSADERKFEVRILVDIADVSACEDLLASRGKRMLFTMEDSQYQLDTDGCYE